MNESPQLIKQSNTCKTSNELCFTLKTASEMFCECKDPKCFDDLCKCCIMEYNEYQKEKQ